jgi:hypothetical protein
MATAEPRQRASVSVTPALAVAAFASIGAGAIHAAAIGAHAGHHQAVLVFTAVAVAQIGLGVLALTYPRRLFVLAAAAANTAFFAGWVLAKTSGISFVDGLERVEPVQLADGVAATLAAIAVLATIVAVLSGLRSTQVWHSTLGMSALLTTLIAVPAMVAAGGHVHAGDHIHAAGATESAAAGHTHPAASGGGSPSATHQHATSAVAPKPYDPKKPIDLGGVPGVTLAQQARAENLIAITLLRLPQFNTPEKATAAGFISIGDRITGFEHYINLSYFDDGRILDPDHPESLVYENNSNGDGGQHLASAMYMLAPNKTLADVPDIGGKLTQWHIHNNLCFTSTGQVAGLTSNGGSCPAGLNKGSQAPMIHVWIEPQTCGPFSALEGVGAGQIAAGETQLCDHAHGSS